jgi:hypothetical protein
MQPLGLAGGGLRPERMSQRRFCGEPEYTQPMLCEGVWKNSNEGVAAPAVRGSASAKKSTRRAIERIVRRR